MTPDKPLMSVDDALSQLLNGAVPLADHETIATELATGRILACDLISPLNVPPHDNSAMDGYAVRLPDLADGAPLRVSQRIPAGHTGEPLQPGCAARIFTGAPIPPGCDAVVMQELATVDGEMVRFDAPPKPGQNIRRSGEDIRAGSAILRAGSRLKPQDLGLAASVGIASMAVVRRLKVAVFFTGDELVMPGDDLGPGQIYNSNRYVLRGLLDSLGCEVTDLGIVRDDLAATRSALRNAADAHDLVLTCGGVSVGEEDHVKTAVEAEGALELWKIAMKPGKPLAFGRVARTPFIGLPGNPVSSFITFLLFVHPFILRRQGSSASAAPAIPVTASFDWTKPDRRREFLRAQLTPTANGGLEASLFPNQGSGVLTSCSWADGLIDVAPSRAIARGDTIPFLPYASLLG